MKMNCKKLTTASNEPCESSIQQQPVQRQAQGILRVDAHQPRVNRASSTRLTPSQVEPSSPQPSVDRLSVTFAIAERGCSSDGHEAASPPPAQPSIISSPRFDFNQHQQQYHNRRRVLTLDSSAGKPDVHRFTNTSADNDDGVLDDDYSISASAIIQRHNSIRRGSRKKRRSSSPYSPEFEADLRRRRSSAMTTSSGDTAISMMEGGEAGGPTSVQKKILERENIKHSTVLNVTKECPYAMSKKLYMVREAKKYLREHQGKLEERLAQTRSTRDYLARASLLLKKKWQHIRRELVNFKTFLVPWESRIKNIESQFGSAVASYFIFLRWLFGFNIIIAALLVIFVAFPEVLATYQNETLAGERKTMLPEDRQHATQLLTLWEFEGVVKYSPFFYGWYSDKYKPSNYINQQLVYFVVQLAVYTYSFVAILRKMAENSRMSKLSDKDDECVFSWKLFSSWDFMIGNAETAQNRIGSIVLGLKEALLEESEKHRDARNWKVTSTRIFVNIVVFAMLLISAWAVVGIVERSENTRESNRSWWRQNEVSIVLGLITYTFPIIFEVLGMIERYHPRKQLRFQLGRIMILNLLNMYSLIYALFKKINSSEEELQSLKPKELVNTVSCYNRLIPCELNVLATTTIAVMSLVLNSNASVSKAQNETANRPRISLSDTSKYKLPANGDYYLDLFGSLDVNDIFSVLNKEERTGYSDISSSSSSISSTEYFSEDMSNPSENSSSPYNPPKVRSSVKGALDENAINVDDNYPHVNYDYGILDGDNRTDDYLDQQDVSVSSDSSTYLDVTPSTTYDPPSVKPIAPGIQETSTTTRSRDDPCSNVEKIIECYERVCENRTHYSDNYSVSTMKLNITTRRKLKNLCWETMFGQELAKVTMVDLMLTFLAIVFIDFIRALVVRYFNRFWCWDLEKQFPQYGDFKIAENILHLVNNQGMVWMGIFFSPGLIVLNVLKLIILMYIRSWTVLTCNVPHEIVFRASRSNNFYLTLLLTMLFLCVLPVGYAITWVEPSWHCGPFSGYKRIYHLATQSLRDALPTYILEYKILDYIASPGIVIPLIVLMTLIIYYMFSLTSSLRESNNDLKIQLRKERTEEKRKMFQLAEKKLESDNKKKDKALDCSTMLKVVEAVMAEKQRSNGNNCESGELTEGEQESLPNDQSATAVAIHHENESRKCDTPNGNKRSVITAAERKSTWKQASRLREQEALKSDSGDCCAIPRIQISDEEAPRCTTATGAQEQRRSE